MATVVIDMTMGAIVLDITTPSLPCRNLVPSLLFKLALSTPPLPGLNS